MRTDYIAKLTGESRSPSGLLLARILEELEEFPDDSSLPIPDPMEEWEWHLAKHSNRTNANRSALEIKNIGNSRYIVKAQIKGPYGDWEIPIDVVMNIGHIPPGPPPIIHDNTYLQYNLLRGEESENCYDVTNHLIFPDTDILFFLEAFDNVCENVRSLVLSKLQAPLSMFAKEARNVLLEELGPE